MKNISNNSPLGKLTLLLNIVVLVFFVITMIFLVKFDKTNVAVVAERPTHEKAYENYIMAHHPLKQDSAEVAYYQYKLDTLQQKVAKAEKAEKASINDMINSTKTTLAEKKKLQAQHEAELATLETEYKPLDDKWNEMNANNDKAKSTFLVMAIITLVAFLAKILVFATYNYKNNKNIHAAAPWMKDGMPAWLSYVAWFVPIYNLIKPLSFFKEIWEETDYVLEKNNIVEKNENNIDNSGLHMGIWWIFLLISCWLMNFILFATFFKEGALFVKANHNAMTIVAIVIMVIAMAEETYLILKYNKMNKLMADNANKLND